MKATRGTLPLISSKQDCWRKRLLDCNNLAAIAELLFQRHRIPEPELFETKHSDTGITGLRKEDRKKKQSKHECRNGFGEGDKIVAWLGVEILPPPTSRNMGLGVVYRGAHQVLRELENAVYQQGKNNDGNHGYRFLPLCVYASFY